MRVKELKEKLNEFGDNLIIMIPNMDWTPHSNQPHCVSPTDVYQGVNEADGCVFIESLDEDE